jgi:hypothetical protein
MLSRRGWASRSHTDRSSQRSGGGHDCLRDRGWRDRRKHGHFIGPNNEEEQQKAVPSERRLITSKQDGVLEFQCVLLWGRVYALQWSCYSHRKGLVYRNAAAVGLSWDTPMIPSWVDWDHVIAMAERAAAHKSLFQVGIVVVPPTMATMKDEKDYAIVSVDLVPDPSFGHILPREQRCKVEGCCSTPT